jgi:hypothetical protein
LGSNSVVSCDCGTFNCGDDFRAGVEVGVNPWPLISIPLISINDAIGITGSAGFNCGVFSFLRTTHIIITISNIIIIAYTIGYILINIFYTGIFFKNKYNYYYIMSSKKYLDVDFSTINCTRLIIHPVTTDLKWDRKYKHSDIYILGSSNIAKNTLQSKINRSIIANKGFIIGSETKKWIFDINEPSKLHVGMALITQDLGTSKGVPVEKIIDVAEGDIIRFALTMGSTLTIKIEKKKKIYSTSIYDLSSFAGKTLYPWILSMDILSVSIMYDMPFEIYVDSKGSVRMVGKNIDIVDFSIDDVENGDSSIIINDDGNIKMDGGLNYTQDNITDPIEPVELGLDMSAVTISNSATRRILLPRASDYSGQYYSITRNYPSIGGEAWPNSALNLISQESDNIGGENLIGIPPESTVNVTSDGFLTWKVT